MVVIEINSIIAIALMMEQVQQIFCSIVIKVDSPMGGFVVQ